MDHPDDVIDYSGYDSAEFSDDEEPEAELPVEDPSEDGEEEADAGASSASKITKARMRRGRKLGDVAAEWIQGQRLGSTKVIFEGAQYTVNSRSKDGKYLFARCDVRHGCSSRLWILAASKLLHLMTGEHTHNATPWRPVVARVRHEQMEMIATDTDLPPATVVKRTTQELDEVEALYMPRKHDQARAVGTRKRTLLGLPAAPKDIAFEMPESLKTFSNGDRFLLYDSGSGDEQRIIIFGDASMRATYTGVRTIAGDGTFNRCPLQHRSGYREQKFVQCYVVMVERQCDVVQPDGTKTQVLTFLPACHALLPAEDEATYFRFFTALHEALPELRPTAFKSDYERAAMNAVKRAYPGIVCECDSFHLVQAMQKKAGKLDLAEDYRRGLNIYHQIRLCQTLMFVPVRHVEVLWHGTIKAMLDDHDERIQRFADYVERTWVGTPPTADSRGVKPLFPPALWSQHRAVIENRPRHNNHMESNNKKLQALIKPNPTVWDWITGLRAAYKGDFRLLYQSFVRGEATKRKAEDVRKDKAILRQTLRWADAEGEAPRLQPAEWANGMVLAMRML